MISSSKVSLRVGKLREGFPQRTPNIVQTIVSQTSSYIVCFNFYVGQLKSFILGGSLLQRDLKFCPSNCLTNIFLQCEFQLSMLNSLRVIFLEKQFWGSSPRRAPKFCPNNCLTNKFLLCEFQLSMLTCSKVLFLGVRPHPRRTPKFGQNNCLTYNFLHCEFQISMLSNSKVTFWRVSPPLRTPKFGQNNCLTNNFLHCEFQLFMLSSSNVSFLGSHFGEFSPRKAPNFVKIIVSHTTSYIVSFNFLCQAVQNGSFFGPHFGGKPFDVELNKNKLQTTPP